jgi:Holliday junction resolvase RusA-like endonuclease
VLDGCNGVAFADDAQVWQIVARKSLSAEHEPGVYVAIEGLGGC